MRWTLALGIVAGLALGGETELPFPVARNVTLTREKVVYVVDGRQRIPWGVDIVCQQDVRIVGRNDAVLCVEGQLNLVGTRGKEVIVEGVRLELMPKFREVRLADCVLRSGSAIGTPEQQSVSGVLQMEESKLDAGCHLDLAFHSGEVTLLASTFMEPVRLRGLPHPDGKKNSLKLAAHNCCDTANGFFGGLLVEGVDDVTVRTNVLVGPKSAFVNCRKLTFDANRVGSTALEIRHDDPARFADVKVMKCDFYTGRFLVWAPAECGKKGKLLLDKCWFKGLTKSNEIHEKVIVDGSDDEANAVRVSVGKVMADPLGLAGTPR